MIFFMFIEEVQKTRGRNHENVLFLVQGALITQASHEECSRSMTKIFRASCFFIRWVSGRPERVLFQAAQTSGFPTLCKLNFFINRKVSLLVRRRRFEQLKIIKTFHQRLHTHDLIPNASHPLCSRVLYALLHQPFAFSMNLFLKEKWFSGLFILLSPGCFHITPKCCYEHQQGPRLNHEKNIGLYIHSIHVVVDFFFSFRFYLLIHKAV